MNLELQRLVKVRSFCGQIINQMSINEPLQQSRLNFFALNRLKLECHYPPTRVDFNPNPTPKIPSYSILPVYNHDEQYFTPCFVLPNEKISISNNLDSERQKFAEKMKVEICHCQGNEYPKGSIQLRSSQSRFCQICEMWFQEYWEHIGQKSHIRKMNQSQFNADIQRLCLIFCNTSRQDSNDLMIPKQSNRRQSRYVAVQNGMLASSTTDSTIKIIQGNCSTQILNEDDGLLRL